MKKELKFPDTGNSSKNNAPMTHFFYLKGGGGVYIFYHEVDIFIHLPKTTRARLNFL